jgi:hypothetical protein
MAFLMTSCNNTAVGPCGRVDENHAYPGHHCIAVGHGALAHANGGCYNIALGDGALGDVTTESYQIQLGTFRLPENKELAIALYDALSALLNPRNIGATGVPS